MKTCPHCGSVMASVSVKCLRCGTTSAPEGPGTRFVSQALGHRQGPPAANTEPPSPARTARRTVGDGLYDILAEPEEEEVQHWGQTVRLSTPVAANPDYTDLARQATLLFRRDEDAINAHAAHKKGDASEIVVYGGLIRAYALTSVAAALAMEECDGNPGSFVESFKPRFHRVAECVRENGFSLASGVGLPSDVFGLETMVQTISEDAHALIQRSRTYLTGMALTTIAHEMGHVVLRHVRSDNFLPGGSPDQRAQEHQADAFARAVCESVPFQAEVTFAGFLDALLWAWVNPSDERPTTHPGARSRLLRFVDENEELAKLGIHVGVLPEFLPEPSS